MSQSATYIGVGKDVGLELWRIERLLLVKQATVNGNFCSDDSYVLLNSSKKDKESLNHEIYIWHGSNSALSDNSVAVQKSSELKKYLGKMCKISQEIQGQESKEFLHLFTSVGGIQYSNVPESTAPAMSENRIKKDQANIRHSSTQKCKHCTLNTAVLC